MPFPRFFSVSVSIRAAVTAFFVLVMVQLPACFCQDRMNAKYDNNTSHMEERC